MDSARSIVFDLRRLDDGSPEYLRFVFDSNPTPIATSLAADTLVAPGERRRVPWGYRNDTDTPGGVYHSGWELTEGVRFAPGPNASWRPIAFAVNEGSELPDIALALIAAGRAALTTQGERIFEPVTTAQLTLGDGIAATLRLGELIHARGAGGIEADTTLPASAESNAVIDAALALIRGERRRASPRVPLPIATHRRRLVFSRTRLRHARAGPSSQSPGLSRPRS